MPHRNKPRDRDALMPRQLQIVALIASGVATSDVTDRLGIASGHGDRLPSGLR